MKLLLPVCTLPFVVSLLLAQEAPYLSGRVNDYAGMISPQTVSELEGVLKAHEQMTSNQVVVLTIASLEGHVLEEYSIKVAEAWKLGQKDKDNGVLLLVARDDRKVRIEVGNGLEGTLTDARCSQIIRHEIVPQFKSGDYDAGVRAGVQAILGTIEGTYAVEEGETSEGEGFESVGEKVLGLAIFTLVVGMFTVIGLFQRGFMGWFLYVFLMPFWLLFPMAILGTFVPFVVYLIAYPILKSMLAQNPTFKRWQESWVSNHGSSGWSSGGWSSGGGGGFSGGGGSFSGGGSSGSW